MCIILSPGQNVEHPLSVRRACETGIAALSQGHAARLLLAAEFGAGLGLEGF